MQSDIDALRRDMADALKRINKAEAAIERLLAQPRRFTPAELVNQTYTLGGPAGTSAKTMHTATDPLGR